MKLKYSNSHRYIKNKRMTFSAMLNSEYFFHRTTQIQMALNQDRILSKDFHIKRAKSKIDIGKKVKLFNNKDKNDSDYDLISSQDLNDLYRKKNIPLELYFLLMEYKNEFLKENNKFYNIKDYNDSVLSFWHFIKQTNKSKERALLLKKYFPEIDKNTINLYSDYIQKLSLNLFKSNPLLSYNNFYEIFFHYLSEFKQYYKNEKKMNNIKHKIIKFLEKLKDFSEYVEILQDSDLDSISRDIKLKNSKFVKEFGTKIKNEIIKIKEKKNLQNIKDIQNSTIMINKTKNTLSNLNENKNIFEDPKNFDLNYNPVNINKSNNLKKINININNYITPISSSLSKIKFLSPNKTGTMNNTISTDLYLSDKKYIQNINKKSSNKENEKIINNENDNSNSNKNKNKIINNNIRYSKINSSLKRDKRRYSSSVIDIIIKNRLMNYINNKRNSFKNNKESDKISGGNSLYSSSEKKSEKKNNNINKNFYKSTTKLIKFKKNNKIKLFSSMNTKDFSSKTNNIPKINTFLLNQKEKTNNDSDINLKNTKKVFNMKKSFNYDIYKEPLLLLYDNIKKQPQIRKVDIDDIKKYFKLKKKNFNFNYNSMNIIEQAKKVTQKLDIEKTTKRVFQPYLSYKQIQKLDDVTKINNKVYSLDINYMNQIFDFKSKNCESIQAILG